jgi:hypothetical protein
MEILTKKAWDRFKEKFLRYFFAFIISIGIVLLTLLCLLLLGGLLFLIYVLLDKNQAAGTVLIVVYGLLSIATLIYVSSWTNLAKIAAVTDFKAEGAMNVIKQTRKITVGFVIYSILSGLFFFGLFYTNIFLFIPLILWSTWSTFEIFAYLDGKQKLLSALWYSKAKVNTRFWQVFGILVILYLALFIISFSLTALDERMSIFNVLMWFVSTPFIIAFKYELYKKLPEPKNLEPSKAWLALSFLGYVITIAIVIFSINGVVSKTINNPNFIKDFDKNLKMVEELNKNNQRLNQPNKEINL